MRARVYRERGVLTMINLSKVVFQVCSHHHRLLLLTNPFESGGMKNPETVYSQVGVGYKDRKRKRTCLRMYV